MIDTGKVTDRRKLRFETPAQLRADVDRLAAAERAGKLRRSGNWTAGQSLGHLGAWINYGFDGNPLNPPWFVKVILRTRKKRYLGVGLPAGVKIPKVEGGTLATEALSLDDGLKRFGAAWDRLLASPPSRPNPIFGPMTHEEWKQLNLRHAELHLSFLHPES